MFKQEFLGIRSCLIRDSPFDYGGGTGQDWGVKKCLNKTDFNRDSPFVDL